MVRVHPQVTQGPKMSLQTGNARCARWRNGLGSVAGHQLASDLVDVWLDRAFRDIKLARNLAVRTSIGEQAQDFKLAAGQ